MTRPIPGIPILIAALAGTFCGCDRHDAPSSATVVPTPKPASVGIAAGQLPTEALCIRVIDGDTIKLGSGAASR